MIAYSDPMPASKYQPLAAFLAAQPPETIAVTLTLTEVAALVGEPLPLKAHHSDWWGNDPARHPARTWLSIGWRVTRAQVRQTPSAITFTRVSPAASP